VSLSRALHDNAQNSRETKVSGIEAYFGFYPERLGRLRGRRREPLGASPNRRTDVDRMRSAIRLPLAFAQARPKSGSRETSWSDEAICYRFGDCDHGIGHGSCPNRPELANGPVQSKSTGTTDRLSRTTAMQSGCEDRAQRHGYDIADGIAWAAARRAGRSASQRNGRQAGGPRRMRWAGSADRRIGPGARESVASVAQTGNSWPTGCRTIILFCSMRSIAFGRKRLRTISKHLSRGLVAFTACYKHSRVTVKPRPIFCSPTARACSTEPHHGAGLDARHQTARARELRICRRGRRPAQARGRVHADRHAAGLSAEDELNSTQQCPSPLARNLRLWPRRAWCDAPQAH
jgi:hypothetical protein